MNTKKTDQVTWWSENQLGWFTEISAKRIDLNNMKSRTEGSKEGAADCSLSSTKGHSQVAFLLTASILRLNRVQIDSSLKWCKSKSKDASWHFAHAGLLKTSRHLICAECESERIVKSCVRLLGLVASVHRAFILNAPLKKKKSQDKKLFGSHRWTRSKRQHADQLLFPHMQRIPAPVSPTLLVAVRRSRFFVAVGHSDRQENEQHRLPLLARRDGFGWVCLYSGRVALLSPGLPFRLTAQI